MDTAILDSCFEHNYSGHSNSGQLFLAQLFWTAISRAARQYFRAAVIGLTLGKLNPQSHPIKFLYSPKRAINRSPTHTLQYPLSAGLLAKGSNVPSLMEMAQVTSKTLNKVRPALEYRLQMCSFTNATPPPPQISFSAFLSPFSACVSTYPSATTPLKNVMRLAFHFKNSAAPFQLPNC
jgi:hypothetical protein